MTGYRIRNWEKHFENSKSRERDACSWCPIPNKQDGLGYGRLMAMPNGEALYGAFVAVVLVASKQRKPRGGHLTDTGRADGVPYTAADLAIKTKVPEATMERMLIAASSASVGWIETYVASARVVPAECPPSALEEKGREEKEEKAEQGREGGTEGAGSGGAAQDESLSGLVKSILASRPDFRHLRPMDFESALSGCPSDIRAVVVREFVANCANMVQPPANPLGMFRGYIRKAASGGTIAGRKETPQEILERVRRAAQ
jgi:hypothetical protein